MVFGVYKGIVDVLRVASQGFDVYADLVRLVKWARCYAEWMPFVLGDARN